MTVKRRLTRERETPEYAAFVRRSIRAHGRRCAGADPEDLAELINMTQALDAAIIDAVKGQRDAGFSWGQIAAPLGITRQAAQMRFGPAVSELYHQELLTMLAEQRARLCIVPADISRTMLDGSEGRAAGA